MTDNESAASQQDAADGQASTSLIDLAPAIALVGHAGVGKTNLSLNLARMQAQRGHRVTLVDMDLVNPYFRSSDYVDELAGQGVRMIGPTFARTSLDTPSLTGQLVAAVDELASSPAARLIIDVGGDDEGATSLGQYADRLKSAGCRVLYVVNAFRNLTHTPQEACEMLGAIEERSRMRASGVVNCSNLAAQTTWDDVERGRAWAREVASLTGLPLVATAVPSFVAIPSNLCMPGEEELLVVERCVHAPWE